MAPTMTYLGHCIDYQGIHLVAEEVQLRTLSSLHHPTSQVHYVTAVDTMELRCLGGLGENRSSMTTILNTISTQPGCKVVVHPEWLPQTSCYCHHRCWYISTLNRRSYWLVMPLHTALWLYSPTRQRMEQRSQLGLHREH